MNYFELHIGDYDQATAHLSACEDGIYMRLIRWYMASEAPLPGDIKVIQRRVRAHSKDERAAVQTVLAEFFVLDADGYRQRRCDAEVARYQDKQAKAKRSAEARWNPQRSPSDGNANASLTVPPDAMRTHSERYAPRARPQTPDTKHQTQESAEVLPPPIARALDPDPGDPGDPEPDPGQQPTPRGAACIAIRRAGIAAVNPSHPDLQRLLDAGVTPQDLADTAAELVGKGKGSFPLLLATVDGRLRDASAAGSAPSAAVLRKPTSTSATPSAEETRALLDSAVQTAEEKAAAAEARRRVMSAFRGKVGHA